MLKVSRSRKYLLCGAGAYPTALYAAANIVPQVSFAQNFHILIRDRAYTQQKVWSTFDNFASSCFLEKRVSLGEVKRVQGYLMLVSA